jgi:glycosyltransferase involved in cell wall biosynthesis
VPVVSTNVGGLPDLVQPGITGTLVPPRDPQSLAAATLYSLKNANEARRLALAGQQMARQLFNVETTAREVAQIYSQIASTPPGSRLPA